MAMTKEAVRLAPESAPLDWPRLRFAISLTIYGAALGTATVLVNFLAQFDYFDVPERMPIGQLLLFGAGGAISGLLITGPFAYWVYGVKPTFSKVGRQARRLWVWLLVGMVYALAFPLVMGGIFLPFGQYFLLFFNSVMGVPQLLVKIFDLFTGVWFSLAFLNGFKIIFTGMVAGALFGPGAWVIDKFNASVDPSTAKYGAWVVASGLSVVLLAFVIFGPQSFLAQLG